MTKYEDLCNRLHVSWVVEQELSRIFCTNIHSLGMVYREVTWDTTNGYQLSVIRNVSGFA